MRRMKLSLMFAAVAVAVGAQAAEPVATRSPSTDMALAVVKLDPPSGSTLKAGELIEATIAWRYSKPAEQARIWLKLDLPDSAPDYIYEGDPGKRAPGEGRIVRHTGLGKPGHVDAVYLVAKDASSREIYRLRVPVDYTYVADAAHEAARQDGMGSRITSVTLEPPSPAHLAPGDRVFVRIGYDARSKDGLLPTARAVTNCPMNYNGVFDPVTGQGAIVQYFTVGAPCEVHQVSVELANTAGALVDRKVIDVDLRYGH